MHQAIVFIKMVALNIRSHFSKIREDYCLCTLHRDRKQLEHHKCTIYKLSLCLAMVLLVISIVFTLTAIMAKIHTQKLTERLHDDIKDLQNEEYYWARTKNGMRLYESKRALYVFNLFVILALVIGVLNVAGLSLAVYGIISHKYTAIRPFLYIGLLTFTFAAVIAHGMTDRIMPKLHLPAYSLVVLLIGYFLFLPCWYVIYHHYLYVKEVTQKQENLPTSKSVVGDGGYIHTFDTSKNTEKTLIV